MRSSHASALHSSPKNAVPPPWASGGDRRISSQTEAAAGSVAASASATQAVTCGLS